jgi:Protein of unknown function (DUF2550)
LKQDLALIDWVLIAAVLVPALYLAVQATRLMAIRRPGGAVVCSLRQDGEERWRRGVVAYRTDRLYWFRSRGVGLRPDAAFERRGMQLVARHDDGEADAGQTVVVRFETGADGDPVWLAMSSDALTGMLAWLEAGPQRWLN